MGLIAGSALAAMAVAAIALAAMASASSSARYDPQPVPPSATVRASDAIVGDRATPRPNRGLTRDEAIARARSAAAQSANRPQEVARDGRAADLLRPFRQQYAWAQAIPDDRRVWVVQLSDGSGFGGEGSFVILDYYDGQVYGVVDWIS